jgi:hypothetical protein
MTLTTTNAQAQAYTTVGDGWCRPGGGCNVASFSCRVSGMHKDSSGLAECQNMCDSIPQCVGFAIAEPTYRSAPNRCYVYGTVTTMAGWQDYPQTHTDITRASGTFGVTCRKKASTSTPAMALTNAWGDDSCNRWISAVPSRCDHGNYQANCAKRCDGHVRACADDDDACPTWAAGGECDNNPEYMLMHCCLSCS